MGSLKKKLKNYLNFIYNTYLKKKKKKIASLMLPLPHALSFGVMEFLKLSTITTKRDVGSSSAVFSNQPISEGNMRLESLLIHFCYVAAIRTLFGEGNGALAMKITVFHYIFILQCILKIYSLLIAIILTTVFVR